MSSDQTSPMTKAQLSAHLAEKCDVSLKSVKSLLEELAQLAYQQAPTGFVFPGIGKLVVVHRQARMGRNPRTGETVEIPARDVLKFRISKICKDAVIPSEE